MNIDLPDGLLRARPDDWQQLGSIIAEAFREDPVNCWIFGTRKAIDFTFPLLGRAIYLRNGFCHMAGDEAATMWLPHGASSDLPPLLYLRLALGIAAFGGVGSVLRAIEAGERMEANRPKEPHLYLFALGTRKTMRRMGFGSALLAPVMAECDRKRTAIYLENSNPANRSFYEARGFETIGFFPCGKDGRDAPAPLLEKMWRAPR